MPLVSNNSDDVRIVQAIARNTKVNLSGIAKETGVSYHTLRDKITRLKRKGYLDFKPLVASKLAGTIAAVIRLKGISNESKLLDFLSKCNRVLGAMITDKNELVVLIYGKNKVEILNILNKALQLDYSSEGLEFTIEYGVLPHNFLIPVKNPDPCMYECFGNGNGCLPILRLRGNGSYSLTNSSKSSRNSSIS